MSRRRLVVIASAVALLATGLVAALAVVMVTQTSFGRERVRSYLEKKVAGRIRGTMHIGAIGGSFLTGITIDSIEIRDEKDSLFLSTGRITLRYDPRDLIDQRVLIEHIEIEHPLMRIEEFADGNQNWRRIFRRGETPSGPPRPPGGFGEWIRVDSAVVHGGGLVYIMPWRLSDTLRGRVRDSLLAYNLARTDAEIRARGEGFSRTLRWSNAEVASSHIRLAHPDSAGQLFVISKGAVDEFDPPFRFSEVSGTVRVLKDSLWLDMDHLELPGSRGKAKGKVVWGGGIPIRYAVDVEVDTVSMADIAWIYPTLPRTGGGKMFLEIRNDTNNLRIMNYALSDMDVRTTASRLRGSMTFGVGGSVLAITDVDLLAEPVDFALLHQFNGGSLPKNWRGTLTGRVRGPGGPLTRFVVSDADIVFRDAHVPGAVTRASARGTLDIFEPEFTVFHGFDVDVEQLDLRSIQYLYPSFPAIQGFAAGVATLDSSWLDVRFSNANVTLSDGPGEPSRFTGNGRVIWGEEFMTYDVDLQAAPLSFTTLARSYPMLPLRGGYSGPIQARGTVENLDLIASLSGAGGTMAVNGNFDLYPPGFAARTSASVAQLDLRTLLGRPDAPSTRIDARFDAAISGDSLPTLLGSLGIDMDRSEVDGVRVYPSLARLRFGDGRLRVDTLSLTTGAGAVFASGGIGLQRGVADSLAYRVVIDSLGGLRRFIAPEPPARGTLIATIGQSVSVEPAAPLDSLSGSLEARGMLRGSLDSLSTDGALSGNDLYMNGTQARAFSGSFDVANLLQTPAGTVSARVDTASAGGIQLVHAAASARFESPGAMTFAAEALAVNGPRLDVSGAVAPTPTGSVILVDSARLAMSDNAYRLAAPARVSMDSAGMTIDSLTLRHDTQGWFSVRGSLPHDGAIDFRALADGLAIADLARIAQLPDTGAGRARLDWRITGTRAAPLMAIEAELRDAGYAGANFELLSARANYNDQRLVADLGLYRGGRRAVVASASLPIDLALLPDRPRLLQEPLRGNIRTDSVDLSVIEAFSSDLQRATGTVQANVDVGGTWRQPVLTGRLAVGNGAVGLSNLGIRLQRMNADIVLTGDSLHVRRLSMASGQDRDRGDTASLTGWITFADLLNPEFDLTLAARNFHAIDLERVGRIDISTGRTSPLRLTGARQSAVLAGTVTIDRGIIAIPELIEKNLIDLSDPDFRDVVDTTFGRSAALLPDAPDALVQNMRLDNVRLGIGEDVWLRSSEANIKLAGALNVTRGRREGFASADELALEGTLTAERGTYTLNLGIVRPDFAVERGTLRFFGEPEINPTLDIRAIHTVRGAGRANRPDVRIRVTIGGTLAQPSLLLSSADDPPIPESDLFSYLVTGEPSFALGAEGEQYRGTAASLGLRFGSSIASSWLSGGGLFDYVQIQTAGVSGEQAGSVLTRSGAASIFSNTRVGLGWQVGDRTFVTANAGLCQLDPKASARAGDTNFLDNVGARIEHRFNHGFSLEMGYEPPTTSLTCNDATGTVQHIPKQFGFDLFRSWRF